MSRTQSFRVVVDGSPPLSTPTTKYEQSTPTGWIEYNNRAPALSNRKAKWICRIESSDAEADYDYEIRLNKPRTVQELELTLQGYAKDLLEEAAPDSVRRLQLTARIAG